MPTLVRLSNCQIIMRTRDHRPAHVHVLFNDGREALVYLADLRVAARQRVSAKEIADALEWISKRKAELIAQFEELRQ